MKKNINLILTGAVVFIIIAVTLCGFFLIGKQKTDANYIALGFVLFSEILLFVSAFLLKMFSQKGNNVFIKSGAFSISVIYFILASVLCIFSNSFNNNVNLLVLLEIILVALAGVIFILILIFSNKINSSEQRIIQNRVLLQTCEKKISDLLVNSKYQNYESQLKDIYEKIKYSDKTTVLLSDEKILSSIAKLEELLNEGKKNNLINEAFIEIKTLLLQRDTQLAEAKRGGF